MNIKKYTATETAEKIGVSLATILRAIEKKELKATKFFNRWQISEENIREFLKKKIS
jgi:excisionase family DNA binding protein